VPRRLAKVDLPSNVAMSWAIFVSTPILSPLNSVGSSGAYKNLQLGASCPSDLNLSIAALKYANYLLTPFQDNKTGFCVRMYSTTMLKEVNSAILK